MSYSILGVGVVKAPLNLPPPPAAPTPAGRAERGDGWPCP